jgi:hypothetical protein
MREGADIEKARAAKAQLLSRVTAVPQVNGVGLIRVGQGYGVKINLAEPLGVGVELPEEVDGVPVVVELVGPINKREARSDKL